MRRISSDTEAKVIEMWFDGYTREYTAKTLGIGEPTVSDIIGTLPSSLRMARDIAVAYRKHNLTKADALKGLDIVVQLTAIGVAPEQIPSFIQIVKKMSDDSEYHPEKLIEAGIKVAELEAQSGKKYPDAIRDFQTAIEKEKTVKEENNRIEEKNSRKLCETKRIEHKRKQTLKEYKLTPRQIAEYNQNKAGLRKHGIELNDAENLRKYLDNMKATTCNPRRFVSFTQKHGSLKKSCNYVERQRLLAKAELQGLQTLIAQKQAEKNHLETQVNYLRSQANSLAPTVDFYNAQISNSKTALAELERQRQEVITQIGKMLGLTDLEVATLRSSAQIHLILAIIENKRREITRQRAIEAVFRYVMT